MDNPRRKKRGGGGGGAGSQPSSNASSPEQKQRAKPKKKTETAAEATARAFKTGIFSQYAAAVSKSQSDDPDAAGGGGGGGGEPDELAGILAKARPQEGTLVTDDGLAAQFEPWRYVGTYMATTASVSTVDALRGFEGQVC
eukprot:SAG22_NODE_4199_length_1349_cov_1.105600_2_plen_141_part_00